MRKLTTIGLAAVILCSADISLNLISGQLNTPHTGARYSVLASPDSAWAESSPQQVAASIVLEPKPLSYAIVPAPPKPRRATHGDMFNSLTLRTNNASGLSVWNRVKRKISDERAVYQMCDGDGTLCSPRLREWRSVIKSARASGGKDLLRHVNRGVNSLVPYRLDEEQFGKRDYWASPLEFLKSGGDCEDFAILKYVTLVELGIPEENIHLIVGEDSARNIAHAMLSVHIDGRTYVLDSMSDKLLSKSDVTQFKARYSISGYDRWLHVRVRKVKL